MNADKAKLQHVADELTANLRDQLKELPKEAMAMIAVAIFERCKVAAKIAQKTQSTEDTLKLIIYQIAAVGLAVMTTVLDEEAQ